MKHIEATNIRKRYKVVDDQGHIYCVGSYKECEKYLEKSREQVKTQKQ